MAPQENHTRAVSDKLGTLPFESTIAEAAGKMNFAELLATDWQEDQTKHT